MLCIVKQPGSALSLSLSPTLSLHNWCEYFPGFRGRAPAGAGAFASVAPVGSALGTARGQCAELPAVGFRGAGGVPAALAAVLEQRRPGAARVRRGGEGRYEIENATVRFYATKNTIVRFQWIFAVKM